MTQGLKAYMPKQNVIISNIGVVDIKLSPDENKKYFYFTQPLFEFTSSYGISLNMLISVENETINVHFPYESTIKNNKGILTLYRYDGANIQYQVNNSGGYNSQEGYSKIIRRNNTYVLTTQNNDEYVFDSNGKLIEIHVNSSNKSITSINKESDEIKIINNKNKDYVKIKQTTTKIEIEIYREEIKIKKYQIVNSNNELIIQGYNTYADGSQNQILKENIKKEAKKISIIRTKQYITEEYNFTLDNEGKIIKYEDKIGNEIVFAYYQYLTIITRNYLLDYQSIEVYYDGEDRLTHIVDEEKGKFILYGYNEKNIVCQQSYPFYFRFDEIYKNENLLKDVADNVNKTNNSYVKEFLVQGNSNDIYTIFITLRKTCELKKYTFNMGYKNADGNNVTLETQEKNVVNQYLLISNIIPEEYTAILISIKTEEGECQIDDVVLYKAGYVNKTNYNKEGAIDSILQGNEIQSQIVENKKVVRTTYEEIEYEGNYVTKIKDVNGIINQYTYSASESELKNPNLSTQSTTYSTNSQKINYEYDNYNRLIKKQNNALREVSIEYEYELNSTIKQKQIKTSQGYQQVKYSYPVALQPFYNQISFVNLETSHSIEPTTTQRNFAYTNEMITSISGDSNVILSYNNNNNLRQFLYFNHVYASFTYAKKGNKTTNLIKNKTFGGSYDTFVYEYNEKLTQLFNIYYKTSYNESYTTLVVNYKYVSEYTENIKEITCYSMSEMGGIVTYITYDYTDNDEVYQIQTNIVESENNQKSTIAYTSGDIFQSEKNGVAKQQEIRTRITPNSFINDVRNSLRNIKACDFDKNERIEIPQTGEIIESKAILYNHLIPLDYMNYNEGSLQSYVGLSVNVNQYSLVYEKQKVEEIDGFNSMFLTDVLNPEDPNSNKKKFEIFSYDLFYTFDKNNSPISINNATLSFLIKIVNQPIHATIIARLCETLPQNNQLINLQNDIFLLYEQKNGKIVFSLYRGSVMQTINKKEQLNFEKENRICYIEHDYDTTIWYRIGICLENGNIKFYVNHKMKQTSIQFYENSETNSIPQYLNGLIFGLRTPHTTNNNYDTHFEANFYISNILLAYRQCLSNVEMLNMYNTYLEILNQNETDFIFNTITTHFDQFDLSNLTYISFNKNLISNNNLRPQLNLFESALDEADVYFKYDYEISKYVFISAKEELTYQTNKKMNNQDLFLTFKIKRIVYDNEINEDVYFTIFKLNTTYKEYKLTCNVKGNIKLYINDREKSSLNTEIITQNYQSIYISIHNGDINILIEDNKVLSNESIAKFNKNEMYSFTFGNKNMNERDVLVFAYSDLYLSEQDVDENQKQKLKMNQYFLQNYYDYQSNIVSSTLYSKNTAILNRQITYDYALNQIKQVSLIGNSLLHNENYEYNEYGNLVKVSNVLFKVTKEYQYDEKQQLISEINYGITTKYTYDSKGNIINIAKGNDVRTFEYDNTNRLIKVNEEEINYHEGTYFFPISIGKQHLTWLGNYLLEVSDENATTAFEYDDKGKRILKGENGRLHYYFYQNEVLTHEIVQNYASKENEHEIYYIYDENQQIFAIIIDKKKYYYLKDGLNNIIGLLNEDGNVVAKYEYSAYGEVIIKDKDGNIDEVKDSIGNINPIRYKGYYYDVETQLYWVSSRYYSPELCRFISPDSIEYLDPQSINGLNLYCYCLNNPISYSDPSGHFAISIGLLLAIGGIVGAAIGAGASVAGQYLANGCSWENFSWGQLALDTVLGGVSGMLSMSPLGWGTMIAANAGIGFVGAVGGHLINGSDFSKLSTWVDIGLSTGLGALVGVVGGPGALNAGYLNGAKQTAGFIRAAGLYDDVLTKAVTGFYRTPGIASNALRLSGQNLVKQWNKMVVSQAGKALTKALAYGGTALLIGTAGKGWLYDWYNNYF